MDPSMQYSGMYPMMGGMMQPTGIYGGYNQVMPGMSYGNVMAPMYGEQMGYGMPYMGYAQPMAVEQNVVIPQPPRVGMKEHIIPRQVTIPSPPATKIVD